MSCLLVSLQSSKARQSKGIHEKQGYHCRLPNYPSRAESCMTQLNEEASIQRHLVGDW